MDRRRRVRSLSRLRRSRQATPAATLESDAAQKSIALTPRNREFFCLQTATNANLGIIRRVKRQVDPPDTVVIPEVVIRVCRVNTE
jgi:hypothetical protein